MTEDKITDCPLCAGETTEIGTRLCDRCGELKTRIEANPLVAQLGLQKWDNEILRKDVEANPELARIILEGLSNELKGLKNEYK